MELWVHRAQRSLAGLARWAEVAAPAAVPSAEQPHLALQQRLVRWLAACEAADCGGSAAVHPGARLAVAPSSIPEAGRGVFLQPGSAAQPGDILTLYPGLAHDMQAVQDAMAASIPAADECFAPSPPAFTCGNHYLLALRCARRTLLIDGRPHGLSAQRFATADAADGVPVNAAWLDVTHSSSGGANYSSGGSSGGAAGSSSKPSDGSSWTSSRLLRQAALGHLVNHGTPASVAFELCPLPAGLPPSLLRWLPTLEAGDSGLPGLRWAVAVTAAAGLRAPAGGPPLELLADYGADPLTLGFRP